MCFSYQRCLKRDATRVFCAVRPPGHHAEIAASMGFCLFNNIALAAELALADGAYQPRCYC
ncbi:MAG: hypothetical protein ACNYPE_09335 [Candidatus Azotimanducaceae bacterium WSBS_2022_MAG_OTU7]